MPMKYIFFSQWISKFSTIETNKKLLLKFPGSSEREMPAHKEYIISPCPVLPFWQKLFKQTAFNVCVYVWADDEVFMCVHAFYALSVDLGGTKNLYIFVSMKRDLRVIFIYLDGTFVCVCVRFGLYFAQIGMESLCFREQCFHIKVWSLKPNRALLFLPNAKNMGCSYKRYLSWRYLNSAIDNGGAGEARWTFTLAGKIEQVYTNQLTMKGTENCSTRIAPSLCSPAAKCHVMQFIGDILGDVRIVCWGFILVSWAFQFKCVPNGFCCVCWIFTLVLRS